MAQPQVNTDTFPKFNPYQANIKAPPLPDNTIPPSAISRIKAMYDAPLQVPGYTTPTAVPTLAAPAISPPTAPVSAPAAQQVLPQFGTQGAGYVQNSQTGATTVFQPHPAVAQAVTVPVAQDMFKPGSVESQAMTIAKASGDTHPEVVHSRFISALHALTGGVTAQAQQQHAATEQYKVATESVPMGTTVGTDPITHMAVPLITYGQRPQQAGGMPSPYAKEALTAHPDGTKGVDAAGNRVVWKGGKMVLDTGK